MAVAEPWMHVAKALLGESEIAGSQHNPRILELFRVSGTPFATDETAWCAGFTNGTLVCSGYAGTRSALAASYASFGSDLGGRPVYGCVVLFYPLAAGASGHVGFFIKDNGDTISVLGGNQSNRVSVATFAKSKVRSYRWPTAKGPLPVETTLPTILTLAPQDAPDHIRPGAIPAAPIQLKPIVVANNFGRVHPFIAKWEGEKYTNHPRDKGGPTKWGITQQRLSEARGQQVSASDVAALGQDEALAIFRRYYWAPLRCDEMPIALAIMTYNAGVNSGPARGARFLQMTLNRQGHGLDEDGDIGPLTLAAANACKDIARAVKDYGAIYQAYYRGLDDFDVFGDGWLNRLNDITPKAIALAQEKLTVTEPPPGTQTQIIDTDVLAQKIAAAIAPAMANAMVLALRNAGILLPGTPALPPPTEPLPPPVKPPPVVTPPPAVTPAIQQPGVGLGLAGLLATIFAQFTGVVGPPVDTATTAATTAGQLLPLLTGGTALLGMTGMWGPIIGAFARMIAAGVGRQQTPAR